MNERDLVDTMTYISLSSVSCLCFARDVRARARGVIADDLYANMYIRVIVLLSPNIKTMPEPTPQVDRFT